LPSIARGSSFQMQSAIMSVAWFISLSFLAMTLVLAASLSRRFRRARRKLINLSRLPFYGPISRIYDALLCFRDKRELHMAIALSVIAQLPIYALLWIISVQLGITELSLGDRK